MMDSTHSIRAAWVLSASLLAGSGLAAATISDHATAGVVAGAPTVVLSVIDERGAAAGSGAYGSDAVPTLVRKRLADYLGSHGYVVASDGDETARRVSVGIVQFEYTRLLRGNSVGVRSGLRVVVSDEAGSHELQYFSKAVHHVIVPPSRSNSEEWVQLGLADVMPRIRHDGQLTGLLAKR